MSISNQYINKPQIGKCSLPKNTSEHISHVRTSIVVFLPFEIFDKNNQFRFKRIFLVFLKK